MKLIREFDIIYANTIDTSLINILIMEKILRKNLRDEMSNVEI
jgi:hypothetical protein